MEGAFLDCQKRGSRTENRNVECAGRKKIRIFYKVFNVTIFPIRIFGNLFWNVCFPWVLADSCLKSGNCHTVSLWTCRRKAIFWDFGTFQSEHWPLSHGFAVGGACSLGFGSESHDPRNSCHLGRLFRGMCVEQVYFPDSVYRFGVDQLLADAPCPWRERSQGFASLLCQSYDRNVENWLLNESGWDGPSAM